MELLAPAADFATARVAFAAGADAVYIGMTAFSARADAKNCTTDELRQLVAYAHAQDRKVYITFNTVVDDKDLGAAVSLLAELEEIGPDALIVQDLGIAALCRDRFPGLEIHASTQLVAHNLEGVLALKEFGFSRVVLSRELSIAEIASISKRCGVELEVFVHGALCYSVSGLCLFSAMEKDRSGNRGRCAYCCRLPYTDPEGNRTLPFSMKDLRLDDHLAALADAKVASLKIEGRMKSEIYVGSVTKHYRQILDGAMDSGERIVTREDLETVFSRRTTTLYADGRPDDVIDPNSLGHLGTPIGTVKRITKDREGRSWLRFHTSRALEKHDGLQFAVAGSKPTGLGITEMRLAISRRSVFEVPAGSDVEILLSADREGGDNSNRAGADSDAIRPGATIYCSSSNEVKRMFPIPSFRPSDYRAGTSVKVEVSIAADALRAKVGSPAVEVEFKGEFTPANNPDRTEGAVRKAFERMGDSGFSLGSLTVADPDHLFAPPSALNELRRLLVERLDDERANSRSDKVADVMEFLESSDPMPFRRGDDEDAPESVTRNVLRIRLDQIARFAEDFRSYDEIVISIGRVSGRDAAAALAAANLPPESTPAIRLAVPVFTHEADFNSLRTAVKHLVRGGYARWEAADLATLRMLKACGVEDLTADWTLYAFNRMAAAELARLGVRRFVMSPENKLENLETLKGICGDGEGDFPMPEFLDAQNTPLFISLTRPAAKDPSNLTGIAGDKFTAGEIDGLWVTSRMEPREFDVPDRAQIVRTDRSWDLLS